MRLYKYLHPDRIDVLRNGMLRFSSPKVLNDPFELKPHVSSLAAQEYLHTAFDSEIPKLIAADYAKLPVQVRQQMPLELFQALAKTQFPTAKSKIREFSDMAVPMFQRLMAEKFEELIGILCLTESPANLLMWAHYADSHQGFVIEFDSEASFFDQRRGPDDEFRHLRKVSYSAQRPALILTESGGFSPFFTKGLDWSYETEWRMMLPLSDAASTHGKGPTAVHLFAYPRTAIRSVIFGCRMTEAMKDELMAVMRTVDDLNSVRCFEARIDEQHFRLQFIPIDG